MRARVVWVGALGALALAVFAVVWFQPQKLVIDTRVSEELPTATARNEPDPVILSDEPFHSISHATTGSARVVRLGDGRRIIRFTEDFATENGPDIVVWLTAARADAEPSAFVEDYRLVGALKGNVGAQNYEIPPGIELGKYRSVVVWCRRFNVAFAAAPIRAA